MTQALPGKGAAPPIRGLGKDQGWGWGGDGAGGVGERDRAILCQTPSKSGLPKKSGLDVLGCDEVDTMIG